MSEMSLIGVSPFATLNNNAVSALTLFIFQVIIMVPEQLAYVPYWCADLVFSGLTSEKKKMRIFAASRSYTLWLTLYQRNGYEMYSASPWCKTGFEIILRVCLQE